MTTHHKINGKNVSIKWERTYKYEAEVNDVHNSFEEVEGKDEKGNVYQGLAEIVDEEIENVIEIIS
jgi:hypothetical protein